MNVPKLIYTMVRNGVILTFLFLCLLAFLIACGCFVQWSLEPMHAAWDAMTKHDFKTFLRLLLVFCTVATLPVTLADEY